MLTRLGYLRRQRPLAMRALAHYPLDVVRVDLISHDTNFIYRVRTGDGTRYALRLVAPGWRTEANLRAEVMWLDALARDTVIPVPAVVRTSDDRPFVRVHDDSRGVERHALLMRWVPGVRLGHRLTPDTVRQMGELFAQLHLHAGSWKLPREFPDVRFDSCLCRGERDALFDENAISALGRDDQETLRAARARSEDAYASVRGDGLRAIHCDLWHGNIKLHKGNLSPFDFEDTILGYRLHDIAMGLLDLAEEVGTERYRDLTADFRKGYETFLPYPSGDLLGLQMGRILWVTNWFACHARAQFREAAHFRARILRRALTERRLTDPLTVE